MVSALSLFAFFLFIVSIARPAAAATVVPMKPEDRLVIHRPPPIAIGFGIVGFGLFVMIILACIIDPERLPNIRYSIPSICACCGQRPRRHARYPLPSSGSRRPRSAAAPLPSAPRPSPSPAAPGPAYATAAHRGFELPGAARDEDEGRYEGSAV